MPNRNCRMSRPLLTCLGLPVFLTILAAGLLAAHRAGVTTLLLPEDNKKDFFEEVPEEIRKQLDVRFIEHADQVLRLALEKEPAPASNGKFDQKATATVH